MKITNKNILCELNILKNRLEAGESIIQCLQSMGIPLQGNKDFLNRWNKLSKLMIEGRILPARTIAEFTQQLEVKNKLLQLAQQKTLSCRIQAYLSVGIVFFLIISSVFLFPPTLKPSLLTLCLSLSLSLSSLLCMKKMLGYFERELSFLEWINFLRSISLSLECGMTLPFALRENTPSEEMMNEWPPLLYQKLSLDYLEKNIEGTHYNGKSELWKLADKSWESLCRNYQCGLPQVKLLHKLSELQEEEFKNWLIQKADKLSYLLLLPLFLLSVPAILVVLFAPLLSALQ